MPECGEGKQKPVSLEVTDFACQVSDLSKVITDRVISKLNPVMIPSMNLVEAIPDKLHRPYPPLFEELYRYLENINNQLSIIEDALSRTEL